MKGRKKMNGKESIEVLKMHRPFGGDVESERLREAIDNVIPLVELRIPKEPIDCGWYKKCPNCGNDEISNCTYCPDCGQNLLG